jgi:integrase
MKYLYRKNPYIYFRMPAGKLIPLPRDEGSAEFKRAYDACLKARAGEPVRPAPAIRAADTSRVRFVGDTIGAAIQRYRLSTSFTELKPASRRVYGIALDQMRDLCGALPLFSFDLDIVDRYSEKIAREHGPAMADLHVVMIGHIWRTCRKFPEFKIKGKPSPTLETEKRHSAKRAHKPWSEEAQELYMSTAPEELQLAKLLLHFSGQRGGDAVKMKWTDFDGVGLFVRPEKTDDGTNPEPEYSECPKPLLDALLARQAKGDLAETILTSKTGQPWKDAHSLSCVIRRHLIKIGLAKPGTKTISMHGLRKNAAGDISSLGVGAAGIKSVTHQRSDSMANYYARHASQIALNKRVVELWNAAIAEKSERRAAERRASLRRVK